MPLPSEPLPLAAAPSRLVPLSTESQRVGAIAAAADEAAAAEEEEEEEAAAVFCGAPAALLPRCAGAVGHPSASAARVAPICMRARRAVNSSSSVSSLLLLLLLLLLPGGGSRFAPESRTLSMGADTHCGDLSSCSNAGSPVFPANIPRTHKLEDATVMTRVW